ncbi:MAG: YceH family protein [Ideonella sp.]|nr:YceH family protein [Ideonella sp.]
MSLLEARVLGVLVEKQHTVADSYPLSLNALLMGCNQKTARDPVINASESELLVAVDALKALSLVVEVSGSRVSRYEHNVKRVLGVPGQSVALLTLLMLRGPQTAAELRASTERLHRFADISSVEGFLDELAAREPPLVVKLPRAPGAREQRWAHLLCGPVDMAAAAPQGSGEDHIVAAGEIAALKAEQARLAHEIEALRALVVRIAGELGIDTPAAGATDAL